VSTALPDDPRWPRAGGWPSIGELASETSVDLGLLGIPAWRTSLSPT
jgi:formiminoglutamase